MNSAKRYRRAFTLIELLVVIVIICILMALLMPALSRAKYVAKNAVCMNQLHQISTGITVYASDNDRRYPASEGTRRQLNSIMNFSPTDGAPPYNIRPQLIEYCGPLNDVFKCPLGSKYLWQPFPAWSGSYNYDFMVDRNTWRIRTSYPLYFNPRAVPDVNATHWKYKRKFAKLGDKITLYSDDGTYDVLTSDIVFKRNPSNFRSGQRPFGYDAEDAVGGNYQEMGLTFGIPAPYTSTANYCRTDGSVQTFRNAGLGPYLAGDYVNTNVSATKNGWAIPKELGD